MAFNNGFVICWGSVYNSSNTWTNIILPITYTYNPVIVVCGYNHSDASQKSWWSRESSVSFYPSYVGFWTNFITNESVSGFDCWLTTGSWMSFGLILE